MKRLEKFLVCKDCLTLEIIDVECRCVWDKKYPTIELEFEVCGCCDNISSSPANSEFNEKQFDLEKQ